MCDALIRPMKSEDFHRGRPTDRPPVQSRPDVLIEMFNEKRARAHAARNRVLAARRAQKNKTNNGARVGARPAVRSCADNRKIL